MEQDEFRQGFEVFGWFGSAWRMSPGTYPTPNVLVTYPLDPLERLGWLVMYMHNARYYQEKPLDNKLKSVIPQKVGWMSVGTRAEDPRAWTKMVQREVRASNAARWTFEDAANGDSLDLDVSSAIKIPYYVEVTLASKSKNDAEEGIGEGERRHWILEHLIVGFDREPKSNVSTVRAGEWVNPANDVVQSDVRELGRVLLRNEGTPVINLGQLQQWVRKIKSCSEVQQWEFRGTVHRVENAIRIPYVRTVYGNPATFFMTVGYLGGGAY